jgi:hypothetical protein
MRSLKVLAVWVSSSDVSKCVSTSTATVPRILTRARPLTWAHHLQIFTLLIKEYHLEGIKPLMNWLVCC